MFDRLMHKIGPGHWDAPTPCTEWSVWDLVNHLVYEQLWVPGLLAGATVAEIGNRFDGDQLGDDPVGRWTASSRAARQAWLEPGVLARQVHLSRGATSAEQYCWEATVDLAVHGWDLAKGIGADHDMSDDLAATLLRVVEPQIKYWHGTGIFDPPVPVPADADPQTRLVALLGRHP
jgi:uncharacterized protein (TIGR03086 family)